VAEKILFIVFAALAVLSALGVITRTNIVHALILLIFTFINIAFVYLLTQAYFLAVIQILVYAGAIMVLFTFVVMFLNLREFHELEQYYPLQRYVVVVLAPLALAEFLWVLTRMTWISVHGGLTPEVVARAGGNPSVMADFLFRDMLLPFEVASLILLAGMVGAVVLAQKEKGRSVEIRAWEIGEEPVTDILEQEV
jgi:NADH-quinone oxidoreductase subunit J